VTGLAVEARELVKRYGENTAVDGIDLDVAVGGCFGFLGPNGAGKTTTIKMITCVSPPTAGSLRVLGQDVHGDRRKIKARLGVVPQGMTLDSDLTVRENLVTFAGYHSVPRREAEQRADGLLDFAQLRDRAGAEVEELSGGMQRRLLLARALVNDPELLVLDEPTTGLDPQARHLVWERLRRLKRGGKTLLLTTHYMEEAAQLCDQLVVLDHGRVIARERRASCSSDTQRLASWSCREPKWTAPRLRASRTASPATSRASAIGCSSTRTTATRSPSASARPAFPAMR
jgi:lipooligosaccharide transport system ATP-binding protein